ncbi:hypothetical protein [Hanstruepera ponticola]|uniref:hypothetical protein n=1 Tax=Hanstruepera ponticola TaxID=2042995 RepID=UPI00177EFC95|nr:hypothetical protein [Hanstruepera ponticola]
MKTAYGIKDPAVENEDSIKKYLDKIELSTDNVYAYNYNSFLKKMLAKTNSIPDVYIFNNKGEYIPYGDEYACNASAFDFIEQLNKKETYKTSDTYKLEDMLDGMMHLDGTNATIDMSKNHDFYIFLSWAIYSGRLNKDHVKIWEDQAHNNKNADIKLIKLNFDIQESWGEEKIKSFGL